MSVSSKINELVNEIFISPEYKRLVQVKQDIDKNADYKNKIKDLRNKQHEIQVAVSQNKADKSKIDSLNKIYNELIKNADIKKYLDAEKSFNEYVMKVFNNISEKIENSIK